MHSDLRPYYQDYKSRSGVNRIASFINCVSEPQQKPLDKVHDTPLLESPPKKDAGTKRGQKWVLCIFK